MAKKHTPPRATLATIGRAAVTGAAKGAVSGPVTNHPHEYVRSVINKHYSGGGWKTVYDTGSPDPDTAQFLGLPPDMHQQFPGMILQGPGGQVVFSPYTGSQAGQRLPFKNLNDLADTMRGFSSLPVDQSGVPAAPKAPTAPYGSDRIAPPLPPAAPPPPTGQPTQEPSPWESIFGSIQWGDGKTVAGPGQLPVSAVLSQGQIAHLQAIAAEHGQTGIPQTIDMSQLQPEHLAALMQNKQQVDQEQATTIAGNQ